MATFKLKNNQTDSGFIPGVGRFVNGVLENAPEGFENPNFELVVDEKPSQTASAPAPAATPAPAAPTASTPPTPPAAPAPATNTETQGEK